MASCKNRRMMLARRGVAIRISLVDWYLAAVMAWLTVPMIEGAAERDDWFDPVFIGFALFAAIVSAIALDNTLLVIARAETLHVIGIFRRTRLRLGACRCLVERTGRLRAVTHAVWLTDGTQRRRIARYWMSGSILADRTAERLRASLLDRRTSGA